VATTVVAGGSAATGTSAVTLLSTQHGRARRELRQINKKDLKNAVKFGKREPARPGRVGTRNEGQPRWQYTFANIVYITDSTGTMEITSNKEPITIEKAEISTTEHLRHRRAKAQLAADPALCATHTVLVIDQSGSMKKADVAGFRSRSEAAYGTLALDYVATQLHAGAECDFDIVSVVEFNDCCTDVLAREPLDWLLFNWLLDRQKAATPANHGHYASGLTGIIDLIKADALTFGSSFLPAYQVIFLSDGRPSDSWVAQCDVDVTTPFLAMLRELRLGDRLTFSAVGLGAPACDFEVLKALVRRAKVDAGAHISGQFSHSKATSGALSTVMTGLSSALTVMRTTMLTATPDGKPRELRDLEIRPRKRSNKDLANAALWGVVADTTRLVFEPRVPSLWRSPKKVFAHTDAVGATMLRQPFDEGAERYVFLLQGLDRSGAAVGRCRVVKESRYKHNGGIDYHETFCRTQQVAAKLANEFNKDVGRQPTLRSPDPMTKAPKILYVTCWVLQFRKPWEATASLTGSSSSVLVEEDLRSRGRYQKYTTNNGNVRSPSPDDLSFSIEFKGATVFYSDFLEAFSHWTWCHHKTLVCDLQGVFDQESRYPAFVLTDPAICTTDAAAAKQFGCTNTGRVGVRKFFATHKCSAVCGALGLPPTRGSDV
jgi:hypothetical protein